MGRSQQVGTLFLATLCATCAAAQDRRPEDEGAYWNQDENDRALHAIDQPRVTTFAVTARIAGAPAGGTRFKVRTLHTTVIGGDRFVDYALDQEGRVRARLPYDHSLIETIFGRTSLPAGSGIDTLSFVWFQPAAWVESLSLDVDLAAFHVERSAPDAEGSVRFDISYDPTLEPKDVEALFGMNLMGTGDAISLLGVQFVPSIVSEAREARAAFLGPGKARVSFEMAPFFAQWNKSYTHPLRAGDTYTIGLTMRLTPPPETAGEGGARIRGPFAEVPSTREDPPYVAPPPRRRRVSWLGNPYLQVPSAKPTRTIVIKVSAQVRLTTAMFR
jgi:hypothetical protein